MIECNQATNIFEFQLPMCGWRGMEEENNESKLQNMMMFLKIELKIWLEDFQLQVEKILKCHLN